MLDTSYLGLQTALAGCALGKFFAEEGGRESATWLALAVYSFWCALLGMWLQWERVPPPESHAK